jgi:hypothetical protein
MDSLYTRSGARRSGDDYQDIVALETIVDFLEHKDRYNYILVEAPDMGSLDDIVCVWRNGSFELKQVKFSLHPDDPDDAWTWDKLITAKPGEKSLIEKWSTSLERISKQGAIVGASVESNRKSAEIQATLVKNHVIMSRIPEGVVKERIISQIGGLEKAKEFFSLFSFNLNRPNISELEESVKKRFLAMGVSLNDFLNLKDTLSSWVCEKNKPSPDGKITYEVIKRTVNWHKLEQFNEKFVIPDDFVVPSENFHNQLAQDLRSIGTGCIVLTASPGSGKSTYLSYLHNFFETLEVPIIRHHYYLSENDRTVGRFRANLVAESLMSQIKLKFSDLLGTLGDMNANYQSLSKWLEKVGESLSQENRSLTVILDGLDHVWREKNSLSDIADLLEHILPTPKGIILLIGTQPIDERRIPLCLLRAAPIAKWRELPRLDFKAITQWITKHENEIKLPQGDIVRSNFIDNLAEILHRKSGGLPLYLYYMMTDFREHKQEINLDTAERLPDCPQGAITEYYTLLMQGLSDASKQILFLHTLCPIPWNEKRIVECLEPKIAKASEVIASIREIRHLLREDPITGNLTLFHNSLHVFLSGQSDYSVYGDILRAAVLKWLDKKAPEYIKWQYKWLIQAENDFEDSLIYGPNRRWIIEGISKAFPKENVSKILSKSALAALKKQNMAKVIEIAFLLDYYYNIFEIQTEAVDNLFFTQSIVTEDKNFDEFTVSNINNLTHKQILYFSERNQNTKALVLACFNELNERQKGNRFIRYKEDRQQHLNLINSFLGIASLNEDNNPSIFLEKLILAEKNGLPDALDTFCSALRKNKKTSVLRALLTIPMPKKHLSIILKHTILLSFEEDFDLSNDVSNNKSNAFAAIYAAIKGANNFSIGSISFPSPDLMSSVEEHIYAEKDHLSNLLYVIFFKALANALWFKDSSTDRWIVELKYSWTTDFITILSNAAKELSHLITTASPISFDWLYRKVDSLRRPTWPDDRSNAALGDCAEAALHKIALDLLPIIAQYRKTLEIDKNELKNALATQYCTPWTLLDALILIKRNWLSKEALDWIDSDIQVKLSVPIQPFSDRALNYSKLAAVFALHQKKETANSFIEKTAENLLAYGYHKDLTFALILDSLKICYRENVIETKDWLLDVVPAILAIKEFTDGDETKFLPEELGGIICKYEPTLVSSYYNSLIMQEDYRASNEVIHEFLANVDLQDPICKAIAETAIDNKSLLIIEKRAQGEESAKNVLKSIISLLGESVLEKVRKKEAEENISSPHSDSMKKELPNPAQYPPESFEDYLKNVKSADYFLSEYLEKWVNYWMKTTRSLDAYEAIKIAVAKGVSLPEYDSLFKLALCAVGKGEAYNWLVEAHNEQFSWLIFSDKEQEIKRWAAIKKYYPDKWFQFIVDTLEPTINNRWRYFSAHIYYRLIEYCFYMQKPELAKAITRQAIVSAQELVSPIILPKPGWTINNESAR